MTDLAFPVLPDLPHPDHRTGVIAVVGRTNAGKSTLLNRLLGEKVSIVSPVVQTTRNVIRAVHTETRGQLVFLDTPGLHKAEGELGRIMNRLARSSVGGCDLALLVLDGSVPPRDEDTGWIKRLVQEEIPTVAVLNKSDLGPKGQDAYRAAFAERTGGADPAVPWNWLTVSAETGDGCEALVSCLFERLPVGPPLFPEEVLSDYPRKLAAADVIREKLFGVLRDELPHEVAVWVETYDDTEEGRLEVGAVIYVNKHSQKGIVIGEKGRLLRRVNRAATRELEAIHEVPVKLRLWVKVEKNWTKNFWLLKKFGYAG